LANVEEGGDDPLGRIVLVEFDGVSVVGGEFVVEVVVALAKCQQGCEDAVAGGVLISERSNAPKVSKGVDHESVVVDEDLAEEASVEEAAPEVAPQAADEGG